MLKNMISYIFIYMLLVGCESVFQSEECSNCTLELSTELMVDENGYHHLEWIEGYQQTFTRLDAYVGNDYEFVSWVSDTRFCIEWMGTEECNDVVNGSSYSGEDGIASTIMGIHEIHIGDTIKVYCGYTDNYDTQYLNSLEVIIDE